MKSTNLVARKVQSLLGDLEGMQKRVTERAYEIFKDRGATFGAAVDDWLEAERQTVWKPAVEVCQRDNQYVIEAALAGVEPGQLDIQVTPDTLLIKADTVHAHGNPKEIVHVCEFQQGELFRLIKLPSKIAPETVKAEYKNGLLRVTAAIAAQKAAKKVTVKAA
jgi:HSP20 family protein